MSLDRYIYGDNDGCDGDYSHFAVPGGESALRAATHDMCPACRKRIKERDAYCRHCGEQLNPRIYPCPDCGEPNRLTAADVSLGYCCDSCARNNEMGF